MHQYFRADFIELMCACVAPALPNFSWRCGVCGRLGRAGDVSLGPDWQRQMVRRQLRACERAQRCAGSLMAAAAWHVEAWGTLSQVAATPSPSLQRRH